MPDIITAAEQDAIARFFAAGGKVTKCPPRFVAETMQVDHIAFTDADAGRVRARKAAKTHDAKGRPVNSWHNTYASGGKPSETDVEGQKEARKRAADIVRAKRARNGAAGRAKISAGMAAMQENRERKREAMRMKVLRLIAGEWTRERIAVAAAELGKSTKALRAWLRCNGYGDKLPQQHRPVTATSFKPKAPKPAPAEIVARNESICRDYAAMVPMKAICANHNVSARQATRIVQDAGIRRTPQQQTGPRPPSERDRKMAEMYRDGWSCSQVARAFETTYEITLFAIRRCGVTTRGMGRKGTRIGQTPPRMVVPEQLSLAGM